MHRLKSDLRTLNVRIFNKKKEKKYISTVAAISGVFFFFGEVV